MHVAGLQKMTLLDFPEVVSCIVFTQGCNFRCPFCHNALLVEGKFEENIDEQEVLSFLEKRKGILDGVVITGGEPLIQADIAEFIKKVKEKGYKVKLDTNGSNPKLLKELVNDKLIDYVAMDIKNSYEKYANATGTDKFMDNITESKNFLLEDTVDYEFRTTVVKGIHTIESVRELAEWIIGAKRYFIQNYKDSGNILSPNGLESYSDEELECLLQTVKPFVQAAKIRKV